MMVLGFITFPAGWVRSHNDMSAVHAVEVALAHCGSGSSVDLREGDDDDDDDDDETIDDDEMMIIEMMMMIEMMMIDDDV